MSPQPTHPIPLPPAAHTSPNHHLPISEQPSRVSSMSISITASDETAKGKAKRLRGGCIPCPVSVTPVLCFFFYLSCDNPPGLLLLPPSPLLLLLERVKHRREVMCGGGGYILRRRKGITYPRRFGGLKPFGLDSSGSYSYLGCFFF